jgi:Bacteriophage baseplate protein W
MKGIGFYGTDFFIIKSDYDLVAESITRILMTNPGERPGTPFFGAGLKNQVFEQIDDVAIASIDSSIREQVAAYEPRANLTTLTITSDPNNHDILVKIGFTLLGDAIDNEDFINVVYKLGQ